MNAPNVDHVADELLSAVDVFVPIWDAVARRAREWAAIEDPVVELLVEARALGVDTREPAAARLLSLEASLNADLLLDPDAEDRRVDLATAAAARLCQPDGIRRERLASEPPDPFGTSKIT